MGNRETRSSTQFNRHYVGSVCSFYHIHRVTVHRQQGVKCMFSKRTTSIILLLRVIFIEEYITEDLSE